MILGHFGSFLVILGHYRSFCGHFRAFCACFHSVTSVDFLLDLPRLRDLISFEKKKVLLIRLLASQKGS